jgi:hypothetical protein
MEGLLRLHKQLERVSIGKDQHTRDGRIQEHWHLTSDSLKQDAPSNGGIAPPS